MTTQATTLKWTVAGGRARLGHFSGYEKILLALFVLSLPLVNPWIRGDGTGYYAYVRAAVIQRNFHFEADWLHANPSFVQGKTDGKGSISPGQYTPTGHLDNHFTIGPGILWSPFIVAAHLGVLGYDFMGGHIPADGFSWPYVDAMALATALYGFAGLWIAFRLTRNWFEEIWAFLATVGIWFGSSLIVYMYFNPSWSHAHSAFLVALFLWYWYRTREGRSLKQWVALGVISGLMLDVYYPNAILLLVPMMESLEGYWRGWQETDRSEKLRGIFLGNLAYGAALLIVFLPTLVTRKIIYGSALKTGYYALETWHWTSPVLWKVLFASDHGLFSWTPILLLAVVGLFILWKRNPEIGKYFLVPTVAFYYLIASYESWDGISSYGNRFFVSLTPIFIIGLAAFLESFARIWKRPHSAAVRAYLMTGILIFWNLGFVYQWGMHLISERGDISWREMIYNQFRVVPVEIGHSIKRYLTGRKDLMNHIEQMDLEQLHSREAQHK